MKSKKQKMYSAKTLSWVSCDYDPHCWNRSKYRVLKFINIIPKSWSYSHNTVRSWKRYE
jgi:hypothetical protein